MGLTYPDKTTYTPTTKDLVTGVPAGTLYYQEAGGGGGSGNPRERKKRDVESDVRNGKVSAESARKDYGVEIEE